MRTSSLVRRAAKTAVLPVGLLARRGPGDVVVLLYHRVGLGCREIDLPLESFEAQLSLLKGGLSVRSIDEALSEHGKGGVVLTFDDGFRDFYTNVLPMLVRFEVPAVLYLATGLVANGTTPDPADADALEWSELEEAVATGLVTVGSHTHSHADLSEASEREAEAEMRRSKELIEDRLGVACRHFAYPW